MRTLNRWHAWIAISLAIYCAVVLVDRFAFGRPAFMQSVPVLSVGQNALTLLIVLSAGALVRGMILATKFNLAATAPWTRMERLGAGVALATTVGGVALLMVSPAQFNALVLEDGPIETASALFWFVAGVLVWGAVPALRRRPERSGSLTLVIATGLGALFVLCGFEEVSWFQRALDIDTPAVLERINMQGELNLHNLETHISENVFYLAMVVLLVLAPALGASHAKLPEDRISAVLWPRPYIMVVGVLAAAWNFDKWNIPLFQLALFVSLMLTAVTASRPGNACDRALLLAAVGAAVLGQASFLAFGDRFIRDWDVTEYREFFLSMGCLTWAWSVYAATRPRTQHFFDTSNPQEDGRPA